MSDHHIMLTAAVAALLLGGCAHRASQPESEIHVPTFDRELDMDSIVEEYIVVPIQSDDMIFGEIISAATDGERLYALDRAGTLAVTDIRSAHTDMWKNLLGEGPEECRYPNAIACNQGSVYILDLATQSVVSYSGSTLAFQKRIPIEITAMNLAVGDSVIALVNADMRGGEYQLILTDTLGRTMQQIARLPENADVSILLTNSNLYAYKGNFYYTSAWENKLYEIHPDSAIAVNEVAIRFDGIESPSKELAEINSFNEPSDKYPIAMNVFQNNGMTLTKFIYKDSIYYNLAGNGRSQTCGRVTSKAGIPFIPTWQDAHYLIGSTTDPDWLSAADLPETPTHALLYKLRP